MLPRSATQLQKKNPMQENRFQTYGLRSTKARRAIIGVLEQANHALTQQELSDQLAEHHFDKATLYRNLHTLTECGLVHRVATPTGIWTFALSYEQEQKQPDTQHAHFICEDCERVFCLPEIQRTVHDLGLNRNFTITSAELRLVGHCEDCTTD
jgi:Fur family ferric uptake transcriptional regulator